MHQLGDDWRTVHDLGHRNFVGGNDHYWDSISSLQFELLKAKGLKPTHTLFDIGCGSLRAGIRFINYLDQDRYIGIDKHIELVIYGVALELGINVFREKRPRFLITDAFEFERAGTRANFAIAQSLFTHLNAKDISRCLFAMKSASAPDCRFFATFFEGNTGHANPERSHSHGHFQYTRGQMESFGIAAGWVPRYIGEWNHPRGQQIIEFSAS